MNADQIIKRLRLQPLPAEGGFFRETYRSGVTLAGDALSVPNHERRHLSTAIYYLLTPDTHSALHRLPGDELFHFYLGDPVQMLLLHPDGCGETICIGNDLMASHEPQVLVPGGSWQGSRLLPGGSFALLGTTMSPGFDFADFQLGDGDQLIQTYPEYASEIAHLAPR